MPLSGRKLLIADNYSSDAVKDIANDMILTKVTGGVKKEHKLELITKQIKI